MFDSLIKKVRKTSFAIDMARLRDDNDVNADLREEIISL